MYQYTADNHRAAAAHHAACAAALDVRDAGGHHTQAQTDALRAAIDTARQHRQDSAVRMGEDVLSMVATRYAA